MATDVSGLLALSADLGKVGPVAAYRAGQIIRKTAADIEIRGKVNAPVDTGNLRNSIGSDVRGLSAEVGPTVSYGRFVHDGTYRMAPRPYMGDALDAVAPGFYAACEQLAREVLP